MVNPLILTKYFWLGVGITLFISAVLALFTACYLNTYYHGKYVFECIALAVSLLFTIPYGIIAMLNWNEYR